MADPQMIPAIKEAIKQNEIGNASPYELSYAQKGASGASFGVFQGDTNASQEARSALVSALSADEVPDADIVRILGLVARPCPNGNPLSPQDTQLANHALSSTAGRQIVDQMDARLLHIVSDELETCIVTAQLRKLKIDPVAQLFIALWVNMTGPPDILTKWLGGSTELGVPAPVGPIVSRQNIERYLQASKFFLLHQKNFRHMQQSVEAAIPFLPQAPQEFAFAQPNIAPVQPAPPVLAKLSGPDPLAGVPFATTNTTVRYWPVRTTHVRGREVTYMDVNGTAHGHDQTRRFFADREGGSRHHVAVDLYGNAGDTVVAVESGQIVHFYSFYKGVYALIVQCDADLVINYGEVDKTSLSHFGLQTGSTVAAGQPIALIGRSTSGSAMCHFETYVTGTSGNQQWWVTQTAPRALLNPTRYLLELASSGL